jgi:membrane-associated PAP2 superfamily phosphatase
MNEEPKNNSLSPLSGIRSSIRFFNHVLSLIKFIWPVFSMLIVVIMLLGLITGIREGWTIGDSFYYAFITAFTIGYGDLAPKYPLTKTLAVVIGLVGFLFTGILVAIAVESIRYTIKGKTPLNTDEE